MQLNGALIKYLVLFALAFGWVYLRLFKGRRKKGALHGRDRLREEFRQRRMGRVATAQTWEERRQLRDDPYAGRRIRPELMGTGRPAAALRKGGPERGEDPGEEGR